MSGATRSGHVELLLDVLARAAFGDDHARVDVAALPDEDGRELGRALNLVLDELMLRRELRQEALDRARAYEAREDALAHVAHELMTPLSIIVGGLETLPHVDEELAARLNGKVVAAADRVRRDIRMLLDAARDPADLTDLGDLVEPADVQVADAVRRAVELREDIAPITLELGPGPIVARADAGRVEDVVGTLIDNAVKHGRGAQDGVVVHVEGVDDVVVVRVADAGPGLPEGDHERLFGRYARGSTSAEGSGVGLHTGRRLAEAMGGTLRAEPNDGPGAVFTLTLRRATDGATSET